MTLCGDIPSELYPLFAKVEAVWWEMRAAAKTQLDYFNSRLVEERIKACMILPYGRGGKNNKIPNYEWWYEQMSNASNHTTENEAVARAWESAVQIFQAKKDYEESSLGKQSRAKRDKLRKLATRLQRKLIKCVWWVQQGQYKKAMRLLTSQGVADPAEDAVWKLLDDLHPPRERLTLIEPTDVKIDATRKFIHKYCGSDTRKYIETCGLVSHQQTSEPPEEKQHCLNEASQAPEPFSVRKVRTKMEVTREHVMKALSKGKKGVSALWREHCVSRRPSINCQTREGAPCCGGYAGPQN